MPTHDLSRSLETGTFVYPGAPPVEVEPTSTVEADGYRTTSLSLGSHSGTHVDAPAHMLPDGPTLDEYPPEAFRFDAQTVDVRPLEAREPIAAAAIRDAAREGASEEDLLVVRTGWEDHWGTDRYLDHPFLAPDAAELLVEWGCHLGVDALNVDATPTDNAREDEPDGYPVHHTLFGDDRLIVENLCGLEAVPDEFELHAYPLAIRDADGSPVRAVAVTDR